MQMDVDGADQRWIGEAEIDRARSDAGVLRGHHQRGSPRRNVNSFMITRAASNESNVIGDDTASDASAVSTSPCTHIIMWLDILTHDITMLSGVPIPGEL